MWNRQWIKLQGDCNTQEQHCQCVLCLLSVGVPLDFKTSYFGEFERFLWIKGQVMSHTKAELD